MLVEKIYLHERFKEYHHDIGKKEITNFLYISLDSQLNGAFNL